MGLSSYVHNHVYRSSGKLPMLPHFSYADPIPPNLHN